jgi:GNAT superfamily N-acetyltransferase/RimJ/RimL family protein N-acetyltransferase
MQIEGFDPGAEPRKVQACYEMYAAGAPIDDPDGPAFSKTLFSDWFRRGFGGERRITAMAVADDGAWVGAYLVELPDRRNSHLGRLNLLVPPDRRRHGIGTALLRHAAGRAADEGRTLLTADARSGSPGAGFAATVGARPGLKETRRMLDLAAIPDGHLASLRRRAEAAAGGYSLVYWSGATPEEYLVEVAKVSAAMADAPHNEDRERHQPDPEGLREEEERGAVMGTRRYSVAARSDLTGEFAGLTQIAIDPSDPTWAYQMLTAVTPGHRGHRLGLLVKVAMLENLASAEPQVGRVMTGNASVNQYMIAINAELGFTVLDQWQTWDLDVAAALSAGPPARSAGHTS